MKTHISGSGWGSRTCPPPQSKERRLRSNPASEKLRLSLLRQGVKCAHTLISLLPGARTPPGPDLRRNQEGTGSGRESEEYTFYLLQRFMLLALSSQDPPSGGSRNLGHLQIYYRSRKSPSLHMNFYRYLVNHLSAPIQMVTGLWKCHRMKLKQGV